MSSLSAFKSASAPNWSKTLWDALIDGIEARLGPLEEQLDVQRATAEAIVRRGLEVIELLLAPQVTEAAGKVADIEVSRQEALALIQVLLADYEVNHLSATKVDETDERKFVTTTTRAEIRDAAVALLRGGVDAAGDTMAELYALIGANAAAITALTSSKAPVNDATLTGTPTAPTAAPGTNTDQIATMAALTAALVKRLRVDADNAFTITEKALGRRNVDAAVVDAGASLGLVVNPFLEISQENGTTLLPLSIGGQLYAADNFITQRVTASALAISGQNVGTPFSGTADFKRLLASSKIIVTTGAAFTANGDIFSPGRVSIEGRDFDPLGWGANAARDIDVVAIFSTNFTGTLPLVIRQAGATRAYVRTIACTAGINVILERIPADTSGTWAAGNSAAVDIWLGATSGSTYQAPSLNGWLAGNYISHAAATNWHATTNNYVQIAYLNVFPVGVLPWTSAAQITGEALHRLLGMRRKYEDDLHACRRYWRRGGSGSIGRWNSATVVELYFSTFEVMRMAPNVGLLSTSATMNRVGLESFLATGLSINSSSMNGDGSGYVVLTKTGGGSPAAGELATMVSDVLSFNARL